MVSFIFQYFSLVRSLWTLCFVLCHSFIFKVVLKIKTAFSSVERLVTFIHFILREIKHITIFFSNETFQSEE